MTPSLQDKPRIVPPPAPLSTNAPAPLPMPTQPKPGTGRRIAILVVIAMMVLIGGYFVARIPKERARAAAVALAESAKSTPPKVFVVHPRRADAIAPLTLPGETHAFNQTVVYARVNGYIKEWLVDIGDHVQNGQLLATIDAPELDQELVQAQAALVARQADVKLAEADLEFAKVSLERWEIAAPKGAVSQQELDQKRAGFKVSAAKLNAANAQVDLAEANVKRFEYWEGFKQVTAPFDGIIFQRHIDIGSLITAGSTASTSPLYTIEKTGVIRVWVDVPQKVAADINVGMKVRVTTPQMVGREFVGTVDRTAEAIDRTSRTLKVEALIDNPDLTLVTGMYIQAVFQVERKNPPWLIPSSALHVRSRGAQVAVVGPDGRLRYKPVTISRDLGNDIEIAEGLSADEQLGMNLSSELIDGDIVQAVPLTVSSSSD